MLIKWSIPAREDIRAILQYTLEKEHDAEYAALLYTRLKNAVQRLTVFPHSGRESKVCGVREVLVSGLPYSIHYRIDERSIMVLRVIHTSREPLQ